jgi:quercetin dioxygenase-like cupin family protein
MKLTLEALEKTAVSDKVTRQLARGEKLELLVYSYAPGATFARHQHEAEQLTIVVAGQLVFTLDDEEVRLYPGEAILIPSNKPHGAYVPPEAGETKTYNVFTPVRSELPSG